MASKALQSTLIFIGGASSVTGLKSCEEVLSGLVRSLRADETVSMVEPDNRRVTSKALQSTYMLTDGALSVTGLKS